MFNFERVIDFATSEFDRVGDPTLLPPVVRAVALVVAAQNLIDNGGLQYFFESDFIGKPPYSMFVEAYRAIGANDEAQALEDAVQLFPFENPHLVQHLRNDFLEQYQSGGAHRADSPFEPFTHMLCGNHNVWQLLDEYIELKLDSFPK